MKTQINKLAVCLGMALTLTVSQALAETYYWNPNGVGSGFGSTTGAWNGVANSWSTGSTGMVVPDVAVVTIADIVYFSGGGSGTVTVSGSQQVNNLYLNQDGLLFTGGTLNVNGANGNLYINASGIINSYLNVKALNFATTGQTLTLGGGGNITDNINAASDAIARQSTLILQSGNYTANARLAMGNYTANPNSGIVIKAGATLSTGLTWVGYSANGLVTVDGGLWTQNNGLIIGRGNDATRDIRVVLISGTLSNTMTGNPSNSYSGITLGMDNVNSTMEVRGGLLSTYNLNIGRTSGATQAGVVLISGGTSNINSLNFGAGYSAIATAGSGTLTISGGLVNLGTAGMVNYAVDATASGNYRYALTLSGGTLGVLSGTLGAPSNSPGWNSSLNMTLQKGASGNVTFNAGSGTIGLSGVLSGSGGLNVGGGTLLLSGANTYSGQTVVNDGTFKVDTVGSLTLDLAALGNNSAFTINGGSLALDGTLFLSNAGLTLTDGDSWQIFSGNLGSVSVAAIDGFTLSSGVWTDTSGDWTLDMSSGLLTYSNMIPEPSALALMVTGGALLLFLRRKFIKPTTGEKV